MMDNTTSGDDIDEELSALLDDVPTDSSLPEFDDLFEKEAGEKEEKTESLEVFSQKFPPIVVWEQDSDRLFFDQDYYRQVLDQEGAVSQRLHGLLQKYLKTEDPQERAVYRQQLISSWWELARQLALSYNKKSQAKRLALRFTYFLPTLVSPEQRKMLSKVVQKNSYNEPIHYMDEWLDKIRAGEINPLATDETKISQGSSQGKTKAQQERSKGFREASLTILHNLISKRRDLEADLLREVTALKDHEKNPALPQIESPYTAVQKDSLGRASELLIKLGKMDKEIILNLNKMEDSEQEIRQLTQKISQMGEVSEVDESVLGKEIDNMRQISKLCVGRRGNHFPFLVKSFFASNIKRIGTRENVLLEMDQVEKVDPGIFSRVFRQTTNRIVPHTLLIPCYGDQGFCWEPFERFNRGTSRGRIAIPMFPKDLKLAVIYALGDLRWNVAKEKAQHYWMEEGLTGNYYQWFVSQKIRGDVRVQFLDDYVLWITKESEAVQKLDNEVRSIFWRHIPFSQSLKESLKNRGFVYGSLYKKDKNREFSDGY